MIYLNGSAHNADASRDSESDTMEEDMVTTRLRNGDCLNRGEQVFKVDRFGSQIKVPFLRAVSTNFRSRGMSGRQQDPAARINGFELHSEIDAVQSWHHYIRDQKIRALGFG